ncbi:MAG: hypothetical protein C4278_00020 [Patescibacteria group bacterium]
MILIEILNILILEDFFRFIDFWFYHTPRKIFRKTIDFIYSIEPDIGVKSNFRNLFKPLYGYKDFVLLLASLPFRILRIISGSLLYSFLLVFTILIILIWLLIPIIFLILFLKQYEFLFRK